MGKKLNALFGRSSKAAKLNMLTNLAISRIDTFKNLHSVRCSQAESDVIQLLHLGHRERALLRVEHVIKEQTTLDAFVLMENYCYLLRERSEIVKTSRESCPDELKEAISSLIYAASRCGEFPEMQEIRGLFKSEFGQEFVTSAVELRKNSGVCIKMVERLSTRQASMEIKENLLNQIAKHNGIALQLDHDISIEEKCEVEELQTQLSNKSATLEAQNVEVISLETQKGKDDYDDDDSEEDDLFDDARSEYEETTPEIEKYTSFEKKEEKANELNERDNEIREQNSIFHA